MKKIIYIATLCALMCACKEINNKKGLSDASLPESFEFSDLNVKAITTLVNTTKGTTSILFGNEEALEELKTKKIANAEKKLVLITWQQGNDPHWFGAKIPEKFLTAEVLQTNTNFENIADVVYSRYEGKELQTNLEEKDFTDRKKYILSIKPAVMP